MKRPLVSVIMPTYGHARTLPDAIASVIKQEFVGSIELLIGEDCAPDNSKIVIEEWRARYPEIIRPIHSNVNVGGIRNLTNLLQAAQGEFVAFCEGDDFWLSPAKLQLQVDALMQHPECAICFSQALSFREGSPSWPKAQPVDCPLVTTTADLLEFNYMHSCTVMYRVSNGVRIPDWFADQELGDWPLHILQSLSGDILYLNSPLAAYRMHAGGDWSNRSFESRQQSALKTLSLLENELPNHLVPKLRNVASHLARKIDDTDLIGLGA